MGSLGVDTENLETLDLTTLVLSHLTGMLTTWTFGASPPSWLCTQKESSGVVLTETRFQEPEAPQLWLLPVPAFPPTYRQYQMQSTAVFIAMHRSN